MQPHEFWQAVLPAGTHESQPPQGFSDAFPATFPDGRQLLLPIRTLPDGSGNGVASLIVNQASFAVHELIVEGMAGLTRPLAPEIVVGLPTLGLSLARDLAIGLGHQRFAPLGTSRKFWYRDELSEPLSSITSPDQAKRLYLDPRLLPLIEGRRVLLVDDVASTGTSLVAALRLLARVGIAPVGVVVAMLQTTRWRARIAAECPDFSGPVRGVLATPLLHRAGGGWLPAEN